MKGFIIHPTYRIQDGRAFVHLFGRLENGESFLAINEFKPYFFIKKQDLEKALKIESFIHEPAQLKNFDDEAVVKIVLNTPDEVKPLRDRIARSGIATYEADIRFAYRFMIDNHLQGAVDIEGKYDKGERVDRVYMAPSLSPAEYFPKNLRLLSLDIETDMLAKKLFCVSIVCGSFKEVLIVSENRLKSAVSFAKEEELLKSFKEKIIELDPDVITGWNVIGFDLKILEQRFKHYSIPFALGRTEDNCKLRIYDSFFKESKADIAGRMVVDGIQFLKNNFISLDDYKLATASEKFLGEKKLIGEDDKGKHIEDAFKHDQQLLVDYNLKDSELVIGILDKSTAFNLTIQRSLLTGMTLDRIKASIASLDSVYLKELRKKGYVASTAGFEGDDGEGKGGFVMSSKPGVYDYVIVLDFKSLYPSIIRTFNIDPLSFVPDCKGKGLVTVPSGACFKDEDGILPLIIQHLWEQREKARKQKNEYARFAIKTLMNSFYGVLANPTCRFYNRIMANAITLSGQHLIKLTAKKVEEMGYEVIYGDTDSIFLHLAVEGSKEAHKIGEDIALKINKFLELHIRKEFNRKNYLDLQFAKVYKRFLMPRVRGSEVGSKKRYAGLLVDPDGNEKIDFVGLEFVRRDWTELAKMFQLELFQRIFHKEEVADYIKNLVYEVREGKYDAKLVYRRAIRKEVDDYTKTTPPHVKAARLLGDQLTSNIIEYVMTIEGPEPIKKLRHRIDYDHYIDKQIKPLADAILGFYNTSFDDIIKGSSQKTLFGY